MGGSAWRAARRPRHPAAGRGGGCCFPVPSRAAAPSPHCIWAPSLPWWSGSPGQIDSELCPLPPPPTSSHVPLPARTLWGGRPPRAAPRGPIPHQQLHVLRQRLSAHPAQRGQSRGWGWDPRGLSHSRCWKLTAAPARCGAASYPDESEFFSFGSQQWGPVAGTAFPARRTDGVCWPHGRGSRCSRCSRPPSAALGPDDGRRVPPRGSGWQQPPQKLPPGPPLPPPHAASQCGTELLVWHSADDAGSGTSGSPTVSQQRGAARPGLGQCRAGPRDPPQPAPAGGPLLMGLRPRPQP